MFVLNILIVCVGYRHSSVVSSSPTILQPRVWIPSTPSTLFSNCTIAILFELEKNETKQKEAGIGPYLKKTFLLWRAVIAQWIRLHQPFWSPWFESQAHHLHFLVKFCTLFVIVWGKDENKQKRPGFDHI